MMRRIKLFLLTVLLLLSVFTVSSAVYTTKAAELSQCGFSVDIITGKDVFVSQGCFSTYEAASSKMNEVGQTNATAIIRHESAKGSLKVVSAYQGIAYSFPSYIDKSTISLYDNANLVDSQANRVYFSDTYPMDYFGTFNTDSNNVNDFSVSVKVQGAEGYMDFDAVDIVPMIYVVNGWTIKSPLGTYTPYQTNYVVENGVLRIQYRQATSSLTSSKIGSVSSTVPDGIYYSWDGVTLYTDRLFKSPLKINNAVYRNVVYYRDLYLRTKTTVTAKQLDDYLASQIGTNSNSVLKGMGQSFINAQEKYGVNALLVYAIAINESGWGTSSFARLRNNLFGIGAIDSNPENAKYFNTVQECIEYMMGALLTPNYIDFQWNYYGSQIGLKNAGIGRRYASDPFWGIKAVAHAYAINASINSTDEFQESIYKLANKNVNIYATPTSTVPLHNYSKSYTNDISIAVIGESGDFFKVNLTTPLTADGAISYPKDGVLTAYDWSSNVGYIKKADLLLISEKKGNSNNDVTVIGPAKKYIVTDGPLNVRSTYSASGTKIGSLAQDEVFTGELMSNGWIKLTYSNQVGYVSGDYVKEYAEPQFDRRDLNKDGKVTVADVLVIRWSIFGTEVYTGDRFKEVDLNEDGKITVADVLIIRKYIKEGN